MKRRAFVRTVTGVFSAAVFTGTGWLMGTRTLTTNPQLPAPPSSQGCQLYCVGARQCAFNGDYCGPPNYDSYCNKEDYYWYSYAFQCMTPYECFEMRVVSWCDCYPCVTP